jgi:class 3 adenylate cyclase
MPACSQCGAAVPADARFCPSCAAPVEPTVQPAEERKLATVLFADLVGSTELAGSQDPERTRMLLDRFYDVMAAEIAAAGGTVEKFIGDAVVAAFGVPLALEDHAERALHAALAMQRRLGELFGAGLSLRIGVNTGEVVVGQAREGSSFVTGDAVNVAARLEQAAGPGEILVGERTAAAVRGAFELDAPAVVEAKGKPGGVPAQRLLRELSLMRPRGAGGMRSVFVGRDAEMAALHAAYERVNGSGRPQLVVIAGDPGVGKTRLVRELWSWLAEQQPQPLQRTGRCLSYGDGVTYWPLAELLREHFGILEADPPEVVAERLAEHRALGLTLGLATEEQLHPLVARERLHDGWSDFLGELVAGRPAVVLIEDVHWAEDDLLDLLDALISQVDGPLLLLATARPEFLDRRPAWAGSSSTRSIIAVEALPPADAGELLERLLGSDPPASVRTAVVDRSEGNPFFVEELLATLVDRGVLSRSNGGWACSELPDDFAIPDTVQAVLAARIDLLPESEKAALQAASVIGRVFWTGPVYELVGDGAPSFAVLEERDFVRRRLNSTIAGEREYAIKHALTREVAYGSLPKARRAHLHAQVAGWLERMTEGDEHAAMLAHHYFEAVRPEDVDLAWSGRAGELERLRASAVEWSIQAGRQAVGRYEMDTGLELLHRAAELETDPGRGIELWFEIGHANAIKYDGPAFTAALERALELGAAPGRVYAELAYQASQRAAMWNPSIDDTLGEWIDRALDAVEPGTVEHAKALVAHGHQNDRLESAWRAAAIADGLGDDDLRSAALFTATGVALYTGDMATMTEAAADNLALAPRISDPDRRANIYVNSAMSFSALGRFTDALNAADLLEQTAAGLTPHHRVHAVGMQVGLASEMGRWAAVCARADWAESMVDANVATPCMINVTALLYCAIAHEHADDPEASRRLEEKAEGLGMQGYDHGFDPLRIELSLARGDLDRVSDLVDRLDPRWLPDQLVRASLLNALVALGDYPRIRCEAPEWAIPGTYLEPFVLRSLGVAHGDDDLVEQAVARFEAMGLDWHAAQTRQMSGGPPGPRPVR